MFLLDTDVLTDVAPDREPHAGPASNLNARLENGGPAAFVAWHTVANFHLVRPTLGSSSAREFIVELTRFVEVAQAGTETSQYAASLPMSDFEDAMEVAARACGAQTIVTRNVKECSPIRAISPEEAVAELF